MVLPMSYVVGPSTIANSGCASIMSMVPMMHDTLQVSAYVQMCNEDASLYLAHIKANFPDLG